jgi:hypothetical protein
MRLEVKRIEVALLLVPALDLDAIFSRALPHDEINLLQLLIMSRAANPADGATIF